MSIAIVTGASSGMGEEFCKRLDSFGLDCIWLIARRQDRLDEVASNLKTSSQVIPLDLSEAKQIQIIREKVNDEKPDISFLINCAGFGKFGKSWELSPQITRSMIDLNVNALVEMTAICIPYMKRGSHIIELCSASAYIPMYDLNVYASSKAFVRHFCNGLRHELKKEAISVTEISPGWVRTDFIDISVSENSAPQKVFKGTVSKEDVVDKALKAAIRGKKRSVCGFMNRCVVSLSAHFPNLASKIWASMFK
ncbi:MAG: SDR family NAD(P)-dependent oxidoreductase [Candidatus Methanomethylophilaceae archaeon]|nr:SDR family NAD(P)-dependent oxidoreductase [Candidatus Methanomethylophilaceae archaeon]